MNKWVLIGLAVILGLLYYSVVSLPTSGFFVDIPGQAFPILEKMGDPFVITFWIATVLCILIVVGWLVNRHG